MGFCDIGSVPLTFFTQRFIGIAVDVVGCHVSWLLEIP